MQRVRIGIIGTGTTVEWAILPTLGGADALTPPDSGAWWSRRPTPAGDIRYQPPATPEIVALCDAPASSLDGATRTIGRGGAKPSARLEQLARQARVGLIYGDPEQMLRELVLDALVVADESVDPVGIASLAASAPGAAGGISAPRWLWIDGPPARSTRDLDAFARALATGRPALWAASPLRRAGAHRAARRLIERDGIGSVTAIQARFPFTLDVARFDAAYAALDTLLGFVPLSQPPREAWAVRHGDGATSVLLGFAESLTISVLWNAADAWNAPLPRFEVCGTQGRSLVCEAGRRLLHFVPREGTRVWEPPGLAPHISAPNLAGYAEDLKAFLALCADNPAPLNAERALEDAARVLAVLEAIFASLEKGAAVSIEMRGRPPVESLVEAALVEPTVRAEAAIPRNLTLDLG